eukprot:UN34331
MVSMPFTLINAFRTRPTPISKDEYETRKEVLAKRAKVLKEAGVALKKHEMKYIAENRIVLFVLSTRKTSTDLKVRFI